MTNGSGETSSFRVGRSGRKKNRFYLWSTAKFPEISIVIFRFVYEKHRIIEFCGGHIRFLPYYYNLLFRR